ncbi:ribonuclease inhibitor [Erwinia endophytica]|uniref:barstar family protein n=1 Tax=Erwinia endophytica TaxID=1563158 RepID=UPI001265F25F|nr:barstar family protein [Erwinia endophytica]KAB8313700.1 ribonuclease inhibitor [Erwinia endophytica]
MKTVSFDFNTIPNVAEFYRQFALKFAIKIDFGANLDALWDALTGMIGLPVQVTLLHLAEQDNAAQFTEVIAVMQQAEQELNGAFRVIFAPK